MTAPSVPLEAGSKFCSGCQADLPRSSFYSRSSGKLSSKCKVCVSAKVRERQFLLRQEKRAQRAPWQVAHAERQQREREARRAAREYHERQEVTEGTRHCNGCDQTLPLDQFGSKGKGKTHARCKPCTAEYTRRHYHGSRGRTGSGAARGTVSPERRREMRDRADHLLALLSCSHPTERLNTDEGWSMAETELAKLWLQSGGKVCVSCNESVPPEKMLPPGPANFYPQHCRPCAQGAHEDHAKLIFGRLPEPRGIPQLDGTTITIGELARRHAEREAAYQVKRFGRRMNR